MCRLVLRAFAAGGEEAGPGIVGGDRGGKRWMQSLAAHPKL